MSILAGLAAGMASAGVQQTFTSMNREADFQNQQIAQGRAAQYAQDNQRLTPLQTKLGMQAAGLNPVTMNTSSAPASMPSAPLGSHASPEVNFSSDNNLMADSRLKNAEAEKLELQNENTKHENTSSYENYRQQLESIIQMYSKRGWSEQAERLADELSRLDELKDQGKLDWNVGDLSGAVKAFDTVDAMQGRLQQQIGRIFETEKNYHLLVDGRAVDLAKMPKLEREMLEKSISLSVAQTALFASQEKVNEKQVSEIEAMTNKLMQELKVLVEQQKLTKAQAEQIQNADWKSLFQNGKIAAGSVAFLDDYTKEILHVVGGLANAFVGLKTGKAIAGSIGNLKQTTGSQQNNTAIYHYNSKGELKGHDVIQGHQKKTMLNKSIPSSDVDEW